MIGFLNINKQAGVSSAFITNKLKHVAKEKVGHLGTLDPMATGVLPVAIGKATRLFDYFLNKNKEYIFDVKFGEQTDTLDLQGKVIAKNEKVPTKSQILSILPQFFGKQQQIPPAFSAKSINGQRAYKLAREGAEVELKPKEVEILGLELLEFKDSTATFKMQCSSGTYVRSVARDIAKKLNTIATTTRIFRTQSGIFNIDSSITLDEATQNLEGHLISITDALKNIKQIKISVKEEQALLCGKQVELNEDDCKFCLLITKENKVYGLASILNKKVTVLSFLL